jgi:hypothetical protein
MPDETSCRYSVFGLTLHSNHSIPGLTHGQFESAQPVVQVHLGLAPPADFAGPDAAEEICYISPYLAPSGDEPALKVWAMAQGAMIHLVYHDGMEFWLDRAGGNIWGRWPHEFSVEDAATYLLGPVLGLLLRLRGATCLHASAVAIGNQAIAFVGPAGAGKSTIAAAFACRGHSVTSDDIVALSSSEDRFVVLPAYPFLSLWPESVDSLYGSAEALPRFVPSWDKRCLAAGSQGLKFEQQPLPLGAVYIFGERQESSAPRVELLSAEEALLSLISNSYATNLLDRDSRAQEFRVFGKLIECVPVRRLLPVADILQIEELCNLVCRDLEIRSPQAAGKS